MVDQAGQGRGHGRPHKSSQVGTGDRDTSTASGQTACVAHVKARPNRSVGLRHKLPRSATSSSSCKPDTVLLKIIRASYFGWGSRNMEPNYLAPIFRGSHPENLCHPHLPRAGAGARAGVPRVPYTRSNLIISDMGHCKYIYTSNVKHRKHEVK